jgi:hypothetical protein
MSKARRVSDDPEKRDLDPWLTNLVEHEGFPLALRVRPNIDTADNRSAFSRLLLVTHELAQVRSNGLPESRYNHLLSDFDQDMFQFLEGEGDGIVALVETFAGKRTYYAYIDVRATFRARLADLTAKYPQHVLNVGYREEPNWETYELYRKLYPW